MSTGSPQRSSTEIAIGGYLEPTYGYPTAFPDASTGLESELVQGDSIEEQPTRSQHKPWLSGWWFWEVCSGVLSLASMSATLSILMVIDNKALKFWKFPIQPNALVSIFISVSKSAMMLPVVECISQLKWRHFRDKPRDLSKIQIFDDASRGPWGAITFLFFSRGKLLLPSIGAYITIAALAVDPFAQQVILFGSREREISDNTSFTRVSHIYDMSSRLDKANPGRVSGYLDATVAGYILNGIYDIETPPVAQCTGKSCRWPTYRTMAVCSSCRDVTLDTKTQCEIVTRARKCTYTTPN